MDLNINPNPSKVVHAKLLREVRQEFFEQAQQNANFLNQMTGQTRKSFNSKLKSDRLVDLKYNARAVKRNTPHKPRVEANMAYFRFCPDADSTKTAVSDGVRSGNLEAGVSDNQEASRRGRSVFI
jgi:hypothetical protein